MFKNFLLTFYNPFITIGLPFLVSFNGYKRRSLNGSGAISAFIVAFLSLLSGPFFGMTLLIFYILGSRATRVSSSYKLKVDGEYRIGGNRDIYQVLSNILLGTIYAFLEYKNGDYHTAFPSKLTGLIVMFIAHYGCCVGDTLSSELGILSKRRPFLITTLETVPKGTNGGVSFEGIRAAVLGGMALGFICSPLLFINSDLHTVFVAFLFFTFSSLVGTIIDSILGATLQITYITRDGKIKNSKTDSSIDCLHVHGVDVLSNNQVNVISSLLTSLICLGIYNKIN